VRLGISGSLALPGGGGQTTLCLVGRELCLFLTLNAGAAPPKQRREFVALAVRRAAPFADPEFDAAWGEDGTVAVWYWSAERVAALAADVPGRRRRFVAEALYTGQADMRGVEHGVELMQLAEGVEARAWKNAMPRASRWWAEPPAPGAWQDFLRACGYSNAAQVNVPEPAPAEPALTPWGRPLSASARLDVGGLDHWLPKAALALGALALGIIGAQAGSMARAQWALWQAEDAASTLDAPLARILDARQMADAARAEAEATLALFSLRPSTSLMAELARQMPPGQNWQVRQWNQPVPDRIEVRLLAPGSNPEALVEALEASPMFSAVTTELGRANELVIRASILAPTDWNRDALP